MYFYFQYPLDLAVLGLVLTAKLKSLWVQVLAGTGTGYRGNTCRNAVAIA